MFKISFPTGYMSSFFFVLLFWFTFNYLDSGSFNLQTVVLLGSLFHHFFFPAKTLGSGEGRAFWGAVLCTLTIKKCWLSAQFAKMTFYFVFCWVNKTGITCQFTKYFLLRDRTWVTYILGLDMCLYLQEHSYRMPATYRVAILVEVLRERTRIHLLYDVHTLEQLKWLVSVSLYRGCGECNPATPAVEKM